MVCLDETPCNPPSPIRAGRQLWWDATEQQFFTQKISLTLSPSLVVWPILHAAFQLPHIELALSCLALCRYVFCYASDDPSHAGSSGAGRPRSRAPRGHDLRPHRLSSCPQLEVLGEDEDRPESWSG